MSHYAYRFGLLDMPNQRSSHKLPTPRGGGIGILLALIFCSIRLSIPLSYWLPAVFLSLVSFFDDKLNLTPKIRILFQFAAALAVALTLSNNYYQFSVIQFLIIISMSVYIVGTANFYNFMDGINGIAGITGAVAFLLTALYAHENAADTAISTIALGLAASCVGFLPFNIPKARVFMGDVGSILLGFVFASLCLILSKSVTDFLVICGFMSTFYADALTTLYIRKRDNEKLSQAHRRHLYQLLANQLETPHWKVSVSFGLVQVFIGVALINLKPFGLVPVLSFEVLLLICWWLITTKIRSLVKDKPLNLS